jgi:hypothetical protein
MYRLLARLGIGSRPSSSLSSKILNTFFLGCQIRILDFPFTHPPHLLMLGAAVDMDKPHLKSLSFPWSCLLVAMMMMSRPLTVLLEQTVHYFHRTQQVPLKIINIRIS